MEAEGRTDVVSSAAGSFSSSSLAKFTTGGFIVGFVAVCVLVSSISLSFFWIFRLFKESFLSVTGMVDIMGNPFANRNTGATSDNNRNWFRLQKIQKHGNSDCTIYVHWYNTVRLRASALEQ